MVPAGSIDHSMSWWRAEVALKFHADFGQFHGLLVAERGSASSASSALSTIRCGAICSTVQWLVFLVPSTMPLALPAGEETSSVPIRPPMERNSKCR